MYRSTLLALALLAGATTGQTSLSGAVFDGSGGPLLSGQVYHADFTINVPAGETLTIQPGAILKMGSSALLDVKGTLDSLPGGAASHITSLRDDNAGGDTNGDGPSSGANADWFGLRTSTGAALDLDNTRIAYGGGAFYSPIYVSNGIARLRDCVIDGSGNAGVDANGWDVEVVVQDTLIQNCDGWAMDDVRLDSLPGFSGNTAAGNGFDVIRLANQGLSADTTIGTGNLLGEVLVNPFSRSVAAGLSLEIGPGVIVKNSGALDLWDVHGTLRLSGVEAAPVVFTDIDDDTYGGDTMKDGATSGEPGDWAGIRYLGPDGLLHAEHAVLRYTGGGNYSGFYSQVGRLEALHCAVEFGLQSGIDFQGHLVPTQVENCRFDNNVGAAIVDAPIDILEGLDSNTATGNQGGDYIISQPWNLLASATVSARNLIGGTLVVPASFSVLEGADLTLEAGTALKFTAPSSFMSVAGTLTARGTASQPVFFSSLADDTLGGDTNGDGPSFGSPGEWRGLLSSASLTGGDLDLEHVVIRNGGAVASDNLHLAVGAHRLVSVRCENSVNSGFYFSQVASPATTVVNCVAANNGFAGFETRQGSLEFQHITAYGNQTGLYAEIDTSRVRNSVLWGNGLDFQMPFSTLDVTFTTSVNGPAGVGNSSLDPLFVDAPNGDLRLALGSPAVDTGDYAVAAGIGRDALDAPRLLAPGGQGGLLPDRGAFEQARWSLSLTGTEAIGEQVTLRIDGEPGVGLLLYNPQLLSIPLEPAGVLLLSPIGLQTLATVLVGSDFSITIPPNPAFAGVELGIQGYAVLGTDTSQAQFTDLERLRIGPALP